LSQKQYKFGDLIELEISIINKIRGLIEKIIKVWSCSGYNCKKLKSMDHFVQMMLKSKGSIAIDPGIKLKIAIFKKTAPFLGILFIIFATLSPETDSTGNEPKLFWTTSPTHYPHVAISRATKFIAGLMLLCFFSKKQR
jgi:hypothetical protein